MLHQTPLAADLSGALSLDRSIRSEWSRGTTDMTRRVSITFPSTINNILTRSLDQRKQWLRLVRSYRKMVGNADEDEFSPPNKKTKKMREWVGLDFHQTI